MKRFYLEFIENIKIALEQLRVHKMRSLLTMLGVIIGVLAVTLMGTAINGIQSGFSSSLDMLGRDVFYVERYCWNPYFKIFLLGLPLTATASYSTYSLFTQ